MTEMIDRVAEHLYDTFSGSASCLSWVDAISKDKEKYRHFAASVKTDMERLRDLAAWFDYAAMWLSREVSDSRGDDGPDLDGYEPNQVVEQVAFIKSELDELLVGFHTASAMLTAIVEPPAPDNTGRMQVKARSAVPYLRVIDDALGV